MRLPQRNSKAFTLIELIVVIVILGILALIAIPTFGKVIGKSQDESTLTTLRAVARNAQALKALDNASAWGTAPVDAIGETSSAASAGIFAAGQLAAVLDDGTKNPGVGEVSYKVKGDGLVLSMMSGSKRICVLGLNSSSVGTASCLAAGVDSKGVPTTASAASVMSSGATSLIPSGTVGAIDPPSTPSNFKATAGMESAVFTWNASTPMDPSAPVTGYTLTLTPATGQVVTKSAPSSATSLTVTGLQANVAYQVTIKADSSAGQGSPSAPVSVTPSVLVAPSAAPSNLTVSGSSGAANLTWGAVTNRDGYAVWRLDGSTPTLVTTTTATTYKVTGLTNDTSYTFFVTARNGTLDSARSNTVSVTPSSWSATSGTAVADFNGPVSWRIVSTSANNGTSYNIQLNAQSNRRVYWQLVGDGCTSNYVEQPGQDATFYLYATCPANTPTLRLWFSPQNSSYNGPAGFQQMAIWSR